VRASTREGVLTVTATNCPRMRPSGCPPQWDSGVLKVVASGPVVGVRPHVLL